MKIPEHELPQKIQSVLTPLHVVPKALESRRLIWVDLTKSLGIVLIAWGHLALRTSITTELIFCFHVPLFFFCRGVVFRPVANLKSLVFRETKRLLVPYFSFLVLLTLYSLPTGLFQRRAEVLPERIHYAAREIAHMIYGGVTLSRPEAAFWFATSLFFTIIIYNVFCLLSKNRIKSLSLLLGGAYGIALWDQFHGNHKYPLSVNTAFFGILFLAAGHRLAPYLKEISGRIAVACLGVTILGALAINSILPTLKLDMKPGQYGVPVLQPLLAIAMILVVVWITQKLERLPWIQRVAPNLGGATFTVMFVHLAFADLLMHFFPLVQFPWNLFPVLAISYASHQALSRFSMTRRMFLGQE